MVRQANDPRQVKHAERMEKRRREELLSSIASMLKTPEGRRFFAELGEMCGYAETSFDHSGSVMNFKEGRRSVAIDIRDLCFEADERNADAIEREFRAMLRRLERGAEAIQQQTNQESTND